MKTENTLADDFAHFLSYSGLSGEPDDVKEKMRLAFEAGRPAESGISPTGIELPPCDGLLAHRDGTVTIMRAYLASTVERLMGEAAAQARDMALASVQKTVLTDEQIRKIAAECGMATYRYENDPLGYCNTFARRIEAASGPNLALVEALQSLYRGYVWTLEACRDKILDLGGDCDPVDRMEADDPELRKARATLTAAGAILPAKEG